MQQLSIEQMNQFSSKAYAAMKDYDQLNTRFWKKYNEQQLEFLKLCTDYGQRGFELWTSGKDLPGLIGTQSGLATGFVSKCADQARAALASLTEAGTEAIRGFDFIKTDWTPVPAAEEAAEVSVRAPKVRTAEAA